MADYIPDSPEQPATSPAEIDEGGLERDPDVELTYREKVLAREARALTMRRMRFTFAQIAESEGYRDASGAKQAVDRAMLRVPIENAKALRAQELEDLDAMEAGLAGTAKYEGNTDAITASLKIKEARARYLGLHDVTDQDANMRAVLIGLGAFKAALETADLGDKTDDDHDGRSYAAQHDVPEASSERAG